MSKFLVNNFCTVLLLEFWAESVLISAPVTGTVNFVSRESQCYPRLKGPVIKWFVISKTNESNRRKTNNNFIDKSRATAANISWVTVNCFPFDVIVFAVLPAHGIWREKRSIHLLDVMRPWIGQWMGALKREKRQLYNNYDNYKKFVR